MKLVISNNILSQNSLCDPWIMPIIQGYIQIEACKVEVGPPSSSFLGDEAKNTQYEIFTLGILSRRSRFRAGTRWVSTQNENP